MKEYTRQTVGYYDEIARTYAEGNAAVVLQDKIDMFTELLLGNKILDVACGPGHDTDYMNRRGFNSLGIDLSEEMIQLAQRRHNGRFEIMDFFNLTFEDNSFNGLWCSSALVHVEKTDLPQLLSDFRRILRNREFEKIKVTEENILCMIRVS
jgi:ubiquinone/menaquinone biosynthesis C-methylase UbiE